MTVRKATYKSERARQMGISDGAIKKAMLLMRELRIKAVQRGLDPRAMRIAILFVVLVTLRDFQCTW